MTNFPTLTSFEKIDNGVLDAIEDGFIKIDSPITYEEFFKHFLQSNRPCIFTSFVTDSWNCRREWVTPSGQPHFEFLKQCFGNIRVPVADCGQEEYSAHPKEEMNFTEYIDYIVNYKSKGYPIQDRCLYLKDWHFTRDCPDNKAYETPMYFKSDWLNEYWDVRGDHDDYRFVYIGPKGSWTPFHADVFRSYSWSANICGRKKWIFYAPGEEEKLKDKFGNLIYDVTQPIDDVKYIQASEIQSRYEVIQESGEVIFVPSGWHHQVINLEDTISINHNWLNGCCIDNSWKFIKSSLLEVEKEISDCSDMDNWHQQCQMILKASSGIDFNEFYSFMSTIAQHRMDEINKLSFFSNSSLNDKRQNSVRDVKLDLCNRYTLKTSLDIPTGNTKTCLLGDIQKRNTDSECSKHIEKCCDITNRKTGAKKCDSGFCQPCDFQLEICDIKQHWRYINVYHAIFDLEKVQDIVNDMLKQSVFTILDCSQTRHVEGDQDKCDISTSNELNKDKNHFISKAQQLLCDIDLIIQKFS